MTVKFTIVVRYFDFNGHVYHNKDKEGILFL